MSLRASTSSVMADPIVASKLTGETPLIWQAQFSFGIHASGITRPGFRLPPEGNLMAATFHWTVRPPFNKKFGFQGTYGGSNSTSGQLFWENRLRSAFSKPTIS